MPIEWKRLQCPTCRAVRRADRNVPNNGLHAALTIFTGGAWLFVWLVSMYERDPWRCSVCGRNLGGRRRYPMWMKVLDVVILAAVVMGIIALIIAKAYGRR